jgi:hypothetical protein
LQELRQRPLQEPRLQRPRLEPLVQVRQQRQRVPLAALQLMVAVQMPQVFEVLLASLLRR